MGRFYKPTNFTPEEVMFELPKEAAASAINYVDTNLTLNEQTAAELSNSFDTYYKNLLEFDQPAAQEYLAKYKPAIEEITSKMANSQDWRSHQGALTSLSRDFLKDTKTGNLSKWLGNKQAYDAHVKDIEDKVKLGVDKGGMSKIAGEALKAEAYKKLESTTSYDGKDWHKYNGETLQEFDIAKHVQTYIDNFKQQVTPLHSRGWEENGNYIVENNGVRKEYKIRDMEKGALLDIQNNPSLRYQAEKFNKLGLYQGKLDAPLYNETEVTDPITGQKVKQYDPNLENTYMRLIHPQVLTKGNVEINPNIKVEKSVTGEMVIDNNQARNEMNKQNDQQAFLAQEAEKEYQRKLAINKIEHKNAIELKGKAEGSGSSTTGSDELGTEISPTVTTLTSNIDLNLDDIKNYEIKEKSLTDQFKKLDALSYNGPLTEAQKIEKNRIEKELIEVRASKRNLESTTDGQLQKLYGENARGLTKEEVRKYHITRNELEGKLENGHVKNTGFMGRVNETIGDIAKVIRGGAFLTLGTATNTSGLPGYIRNSLDKIINIADGSKATPEEIKRFQLQLGADDFTRKNTEATTKHNSENGVSTSNSAFLSTIQALQPYGDMNGVNTSFKDFGTPASAILTPTGVVVTNADGKTMTLDKSSVQDFKTDFMRMNSKSFENNEASQELFNTIVYPTAHIIERDMKSHFQDAPTTSFNKIIKYKDVYYNATVKQNTIGTYDLYLDGTSDTPSARNLSSTAIAKYLAGEVTQ